MENIILNIGEKQIDYRNYTLSLLSLCSARGIINENYAAAIRSGLNGIFTEIASQYTKRLSSTVSMKAAETLYNSVLFACDAWLLDLKNDNAAVNELCVRKITDIYSDGILLLLKLYDKSHEIFREVYQTWLKLPFCEYSQVIEKEFDRFYSSYDARFDARNICASIEYPLLYGNFFEADGVLYIIRYYSSLLAENKLCGLFSADDLTALFGGVARLSCCRPEDLYINAAECVLNNYFCTVLSGGNGLFPTKKQLERLNDLTSEIAVKSAAEAALEKLGDKLPDCLDYFKPYTSTFAKYLFGHITNKNLAKFAVTLP